MFLHFCASIKDGRISSQKFFGQWKTHCPKTHSQHFTRRLESAPRHWPSHPSSSSQHLKNVGGLRLWARRFFFPTWFVKNIARSLQADTKFWLNNFVTIHFLSFLPATHCHLVQCPRLSVRATWKSDNSTWHTVTPYQRKQNKSPLLHASLTSSFYCQRRDPTNEKGCSICATKVNHSMARNNAGGKNDKMAQKKYDYAWWCMNDIVGDENDDDHHHQHHHELIIIMTMMMIMKIDEAYDE